MKKIAALVLVMVGAGFYATPYLAVNDMRNAAKARDATTLNQYIDYPAVKESLKQSLNSDMSKTLLKDKTDSGMNAFATMFASAFVNPLIDILVTPENMALMLQAEMPKALDTHDTSTPNENNNSKQDELIISKHYQNFDHFVVTMAKKSHPDLVFTFTLARIGLVNWQLKGLAVPQLAK